MSGIGRIMSLRKYRGRLSYLPYFPEEVSAPLRLTCRPKPPPPRLPRLQGTLRPQRCGCLPQRRLPRGMFAALALGSRQVIEDEFVTVLALNTAWLSTDAFLGPFRCDPSRAAAYLKLHQ